VRALPACLTLTAVVAVFTPADAQSNDPNRAYNAGRSGESINQATATYEEKSAYNRGAADKDADDAAAFQASRASAEAGMKAQAATRAELEAIRSRLLKQPPLPAAKNPLLGRWVMISPKSQGLMDMVLDPEAAVCAAVFGDEPFEYRADAVLLEDDGQDVVADRIAYRAGKGGSVFVLGEKLVRLLLFEFDVGKDRAKFGNCIYARVRAPSAAPASRAATPTPSAVAASAAPAGVARTYKGAGFKVAGVALGVDGTPQVHQVNKARGADEVMGSTGSLGAWRVYARGVSFADIDPRIVSIGYDFDQEDFAVARLIAVTFFFDRGSAAGASPVVQERAKALATKYGLPAPAAGARWEGKTGEVTLIVADDAANGVVGETYLLK